MTVIWSEVSCAALHIICATKQASALQATTAEHCYLKHWVHHMLASHFVAPHTASAHLTS
jgi:hypothetical protein